MQTSFALSRASLPIDIPGSHERSHAGPSRFSRRGDANDLVVGTSRPRQSLNISKNELADLIARNLSPDVLASELQRLITSNLGRLTADGRAFTSTMAPCAVWNALSHCPYLTHLTIDLRFNDRHTIETALRHLPQYDPFRNIEHYELKIDQYPANNPHILDRISQSSFKQLRVSRARLDDTALETFGAMPKLEALDIYENPEVGSRGIKALVEAQHGTGSRRQHLKQLKLSRADDAMLEQVSALKSLERLELSFSLCTSEGMRKLGAMRTLKSLSIESSPLGPGGAAPLATSASLQELSIHGCDIDERDIAALLESKTLTSLRVNGEDVLRPAARRLSSVI
ncbi:MAG TPA: hypothetical protein VFS42_00045 [Burkholderiaceae bacterium]|nr:hypothetical protein [Burkholderiaceae bacterium]